MAGAVVSVELVVLSGLGQRLVDLVDLVGGRKLVVVAEQPEHRAADVGRAVDQRHHRRQLRRRLTDDEPSAATHARPPATTTGEDSQLE